MVEFSGEDLMDLYDALGAGVFLVKREMVSAELDDLDTLADRLVRYEQLRRDLRRDMAKLEVPTP